MIRGPFAYAEQWDEATQTYRGIAIDNASNVPVKHVERAQKFSLLVFGFIWLVISAALQIIVLLVSSS